MGKVHLKKAVKLKQSIVFLIYDIHFGMIMELQFVIRK